MCSDNMLAYNAVAVHTTYSTPHCRNSKKPR